MDAMWPANALTELTYYPKVGYCHGGSWPFKAIKSDHRHPDEAMRSLDAAINDGEQALDDSRNAIQDRTN